MTDQPSVAIERALPTQIALATDDEVRRMFRIAEALANSGSFKGITKPAQAFAKMVIGRDLGMSPAQAMLGLHLVDGSVQVHYAMLGRFIKSRAEEGYDYRAGWLKEDPVPEGQADRPRSFVWMNEDDPADQRPVVGASVTFWAHGEQVGVSTFTHEDAVLANLIKPDLDRRAAWATARRNMYLARAMSNGVKWFVPEVLGGLPIYVEGEIVSSGTDLTEGSGTGEVQNIDLGPRVEWVLERAKELGHAGLADRATAEVALGNRSPEVVNQWVAAAREELERYEAELSQEPPDAEVVEDDRTVDAKIAEAVREDARTANTMEAQVWLNRLGHLRDARGEEQDPEKRAQIDEEIEHIEAQLRARGVDVPS